MAKRARNSTAASGSGAENRSATAPTTEERLGDFAEDLGRFLGGTQAKASAWLDQRKKLLENLVKVRDTAAHYIEQLGGAAAAPRPVGRPRGPKTRRGPGRPAAAASNEASPKKRKRTMSVEARAKISAAQRARWARQRKG